MKKSERETKNVIENDNLAKENNGSNMILNYYFKIVSFLLLLSLVFWFGYKKGEEKNPMLNNISATVENGIKKDNEKVDFSLFWKVWSLLEKKYVDADKLTPQDLLYNSIKGMMWATKDPYTVFLEPKEVKEFNSEIDGKFEGIGAEIGIKQGVLTIIAPLKDSPAEKSGLKAGDKVIKINGESTAEMTIDEAVNKMRGKKGTEVKLTVFRNNGEDKTKEITITRGIIEVKSVDFEMKNNIPYFKIVRFGNDTAKLFRELTKKIPANAPGVIIDLRNNPGGYLDASVEMASLILPRGDVIVIEKYRDGKEDKLYSYGYKNILNKKKIVVLINEGSASASEILAGALKDDAKDRVTIVGKKSFGKGSVQELINLPNGSATKITVAKWLTPTGEQINKKGISPDIEVDLTNQDYENDLDPQLDKALKLLK